LIARILARRTSFGRLTAVLIVAAVLGPSGDTQTGGGRIGPHRSAVVTMSVQSSVQPAVESSVQPLVEPAVQPLVEPAVQPLVEPTVQPMVPGPLTDPGLDLRAGPVDVPLELRIPSLQINAPVVGVGITAENVMDAPQGLAADPVWQKAFWYRGSGIPGNLGTALLAGHVDDILGRPAVFARLRDLRSGDLIVVHDTRSGLDVRFTVAKTETYTVQQAADPSVLTQIYGSGPVSGRGPQPAPDGLAHLTLITCTGGFVNGSFNHRLVVYATRSESK
jgi:sortase (surface protein transpeptidase)